MTVTSRSILRRRPRTWNPAALRAAALLSWFAVGCAVPIEDGDRDERKVAVIEQAVTGGFRAPISALPDNGIVRINAGGTCTGALLTNRWVLTADHCFCPSHVNNPGGVSVSVYGTLDAQADPTLAPLYTTTASQIIRHPTYDVALVKLTQTLPFTWAPQIYTGNGSDLVNKQVRVIGFGNNRFSGSTAVGAGESEYFGDMRVTSVAPQSTAMLLRFCSPQSDNYWTKDHPGPRLASLAGDDVDTQEGDSGSPAFLDSLESKKIIGVLFGKDGGTAYTGIWHVRDWIKQQTGIWTQNECSNTSLPSSSGTDKPAIATGPDGKLHAVAVRPNKTIGHWSSTNAKQWTYHGVIAGASTDSTPGLTTELSAASGQPLKLGLAYRNPTNNALMYARWSASGGWSTPQAVPFLQVSGGVGAHAGVIAFTGLNGRAGVTAYEPASNTFIPAQWAPAGSPAVDPARGISVVHDPATATALVGYRTASNQWVQIFGTWNCFSTTGSFLCNADPPYNTDWNQASLAYLSGERVHLETVRILPSGWPRHERRVVAGSASFDWGWAQHLLGTQAVTDFNGEIYAIRSTYGGSLLISPSGNCFANPF